MIPHTIHQTWDKEEIPAEWRPYRATWIAQNPGWSSVLWDAAGCRELVAAARPELLSHYDAYPEAIQRADAFRYVLLSAQGGLYVDLDFECLRPVDPLLDDQSVVLGLEPPSHADDDAVRGRGLDRIVCNAFMASEPGHPFWDHVLELVARADPRGPVLDSTGAFLLTHAVDTFRRPEDLRIVDADVLYPRTKWEAWGDRPVAPDADDRLGRAIAVHHWSSSWQRPRLQSLARELAERRSRRERA